MATANLDLRIAPAARLTRAYDARLGYFADRPRLLVPIGGITEDSRDYLIAPQSHALLGRLGRAIQGDTHGAEVGLLESKWGAIPRRLLSLSSPTLTDGYPTYMVLYTEETRTKRFGQLWWRSTNSGLTAAQANHTFGEEFSATTYPVNSATETKFKMSPLPYITEGTLGSTKATGMTRCAFEFARRFTAPGSRNVGFFDSRAYAPNFHGCPLAWDRQWNDTTGSAPNTLRAEPWGNVPPLYAPTQGTAAAAAGTTDRNWRSGDAYYLSVAYQYEDGSWSRPFQIRRVGSVVTAARGGLVVIGNGTTVSYHRSILYQDIPRGGKRVVARALLRTRKININTVSSPPDGFATGQVSDIPEHLYIVKIIRNNTDTSYEDFNGSDDSLESADTILNRHAVWPPAARFLFPMDERVVLGYTRLPPPAMILAPTGRAASRDLNLPDDSSLIYSATTQYFYRLTFNAQTDAQTFELNKTASGVGGTTVTVSGGTIQDLIDNINETLFGGNAGEWAAQPVPGVDETWATSALAPTIITVPSCTLGTAGDLSTATASGFAQLALGMKVRIASGTGSIPADSIVIAKASDTAVTLGDVNGAAIVTTAGSPTIEAYVDTGDSGGISGKGFGWVRAFSPSLYGIVALRASVIDGFRTDTQSLWITGVTPGAAVPTPSGATVTPGGSTISANYFINDGKHRRGPPADAGIFMGGGPLNNGGVACYSRGIYQLQNRKDGNSGEDIGYRFYPVNSKRGCISPWSIVVGDDWVGYLTREGYCVTDRAGRELIISGKLWDPAVKIVSSGTPTGRGVLGYEVARCSASAESDGDDYGFHAWIDGHRLWISYRLNASTRLCQCYDFSEGAESTGLDEVAVRQPSGAYEPRPWSPPITWAVVAGGSIGTNSPTLASRNMACVDTNAGSAGDGRVDLLETGTDDNGTAFTPLAYFPMDLGPSLRRPMRIMRVTSLHRARATGLKLLVSRDNARATQQVLSLGAANSDDDPAEVTIPKTLRKYAEVVEFGYRDDAVSSDRSEAFRLEVEYDVANV